MRKKIISLFAAVCLILGTTAAPANASVPKPDVSEGLKAELSASGEKQIEYLTRGLIAIKTNGGMYLSWRLLGTEPMDTTFNIYKNGAILDENVRVTNYTDSTGGINDSYSVAAVINGTEGTASAPEHVISDYADVPYIDVPIEKPVVPGCTYDANDASVGDVDGDGEYEIILKWNPENAKDNASSGKTGNVFIDAYELDGTRLWRIDLGVNIRAGAHYTQFMVYDFDGDGKAEMILKTAPGSKDSKGEYVTKVGNTPSIRNASDNETDYRSNEGGKKTGHVLSGEEYLTVFSGETGEALQTIDYYPKRNVCSWGDDYGNRADRFLAGVAYLDGKTPSVIMCRGYYTNAYLAAYNWDGENLNKVWFHNSVKGSSSVEYADGTTKKSSVSVYGQGAHALSVADVDGDGCDEIIYGAGVVDHDGTALTSTGWGHGDSLHVTDFNNDGVMEVFQSYEDQPGAGFRVAKDSKKIFRTTADNDVGRGLAANMSAKYPYALLWSSAGMFDINGAEVTVNGTSKAMPNFAIYWDGDLYREVLDGLYMVKWNDDANAFDRIWTIYQKNPVNYNNSTKQNPCLQADLFGDFREEIVMRHSDNSALRIFTSPIPSDYKFTTFMHDTQYRCAIAWQNVGYNQPPHPSYFIGYQKTDYAQPSVYSASEPAKVEFNVTASGEAVEGAKVTAGNLSAFTNAEGKAVLELVDGSYDYEIKKIGLKTVRKNGALIVNGADKTVNETMEVKTTTEISVSYYSEDGEKLKESEVIENIAVGTEYRLDDKYKEDLNIGEKTYIYNANLSDECSFTADEDVDIKLVFSPKKSPGDKILYTTNLSKDGYLSTNPTHGYSTNELEPVNYDVLGNTKIANYNIGDKTIDINFAEGSSDFVLEFDMVYNSYDDATTGGSIFGATLYDGKGNIGTTIGLRFTGSKIPQFAAYTGGSNTNVGATMTAGTLYHYVARVKDGSIELKIADKNSGNIVYNNTVGTRNIGNGAVTKISFNRETGSGNANIGLSDIKAYVMNRATLIETSESNVIAGIPSETYAGVSKFVHETDVKGLEFDMSDALTYEFTKADGGAVTDSKVSFSEDGTLRVLEDADKEFYKVEAIYGGETIANINVRTATKSDVNLYDKTDADAGNLFVYNGGDGASLSYKDGSWTFDQNSTGGKEFEGEFFSKDSGTAKLDFIFGTGGTKDSSDKWNWEGRAYNYKIQFLDADYNGTYNNDNLVFEIMQTYTAANGATEAVYNSKTANNILINSGTKVDGDPTEGITSRSASTWHIIVYFDFDNRTLDFEVRQFDTKTHTTLGGFRFDKVPMPNGFKTLRFVSEGDNTVQWKPTIQDVVYSSTAFSPAKVDGETVIKGNCGSAEISVDSPSDNGGAAITSYRVIPVKDGVELPEVVSNSSSIVIPNVTTGEYSFKIVPVNKVGEGHWTTLDKTIKFSDIIINRSEHGTVSTKATIGGEGEEIQLDVKPDDGYALDRVTIVDANNNEISSDDIQNIFTMPESSITITAEFTEYTAPEPTDGAIQMEIKSTTENEDGAVISLDISNETNEAVSGLVIICVKNSSVVKSVTQKPAEVEKDSVATEEITVKGYDPENDTIDIYFWKDLDVLEPICSALQGVGRQ